MGILINRAKCVAGRDNPGELPVSLRTRQNAQISQLYGKMLFFTLHITKIIFLPLPQALIPLSLSLVPCDKVVEKKMLPWQRLLRRLWLN